MGSPDNLAAALHIIESFGLPFRLRLNCSKFLLYIPESQDILSSPLPPEIPITRHGFSLLGFPVGPPEYYEEVFQTKLAKLQTTLDAVHEMGDSQMEATLLCSCLALPKVTFVLRACPPCHIANSTKAFDATIHHTLENIIGGWWPPFRIVRGGGGGEKLASLVIRAALTCEALLSMHQLLT